MFQQLLFFLVHDFSQNSHWETLGLPRNSPLCSLTMTPRVNDRVKQAAKLFIYTLLVHLFACLIVRVRLMLFSN